MRFQECGYMIKLLVERFYYPAEMVFATVTLFKGWGGACWGETWASGQGSRGSYEGGDSCSSFTDLAVLSVKPSSCILLISLVLGNHQKAWPAGFLCHYVLNQICIFASTFLSFLRLCLMSCSVFCLTDTPMTSGFISCK